MKLLILFAQPRDLVYRETKLLGECVAILFQRVVPHGGDELGRGERRWRRCRLTRRSSTIRQSNSSANE